MKKIYFTFTLLIFTMSSIIGQDYTNDLQGINKIRIIVSGSTDLKIIGTNEGDLTIHSDNFESEEKRKGLRAIYANGYDNSNIGLSVENVSGELVIRKLKAMSSDDYVFYIPKDFPFSAKVTLSGEVSIKGFDSEIEVKTLSGDITIEDVTGPILANSTSGDIKVDFVSLAQHSPMSFVTVSGDVEIEFPEGSKANVTMQTLSGTAFTNIDDLEIIKNDETKEKFKKEKKKLKKEKKKWPFKIDFSDNWLNNWNSSGFNEKIEAKVNGGGVKIFTKSISGDVIIKEDD